MIFLSKWYKSKHWQFFFAVISDHPRGPCAQRICWPLCLRALEELSYFQGIIIIICMWCRQHACIPFVAFFFARFNSQSQKMRGTHSIPASERKSAKERVAQRQNKQISKHFFLSRHQTSYAMKQRAAARLNWHIDNFRPMMRRKEWGAERWWKGGSERKEWKRDQPKLTTIMEW